MNSGKGYLHFKILNDWKFDCWVSFLPFLLSHTIRESKMQRNTFGSNKMISGCKCRICGYEAVLRRDVTEVDVSENIM